MYPTLTLAHDDELEHRILEFLHARGIANVEKLCVRVAGGVATVSGQVQSLHDKVTCLECCRHVAGVLRVVDRTRIRRSRNKSSLLPAAPVSPSQNWIEWTG